MSEKRMMSKEQWTILGVGVALFGYIGIQIADVRSDLGVQISDVRSDLGAQIAEVRGSITDLGEQIASLRERMARVEARLNIALPMPPVPDEQPALTEPSPAPEQKIAASSPLRMDSEGD